MLCFSSDIAPKPASRGGAANIVIEYPDGQVFQNSPKNIKGNEKTDFFVSD
jgi:hypothetical protein